MIRAMYSNTNVFIPWINSIKSDISLQTKFSRAVLSALIDSGATENCIHHKVVKHHNLPWQELPQPCIIRNSDNSINLSGVIKRVVKLDLQYAGKQIPYQFLVADIGNNEMILGYPFLVRTNPPTNWKEGKLYGSIAAFAPGHKSFSEGTESLCQEYETFIKQVDKDIRVKKTTISTQLAIQSKQEAKDWKEIVPPHYHSFRRVFSEEDCKRFPDSKPWDHAIDLLPNAPNTIDCKINPLPRPKQEAQDKFLAQNLAKKYIRRSKSLYTARQFFVDKKDGELRPVMDYCPINKHMVKNKYPIPNAKEQLAKLHKKQWFTKLDVRWGYNNICIKEGDQWKTAFKTNRGLFECNVMFFGLCNSPATFQTLMDEAFKELIDKGTVFVYMDDIVITTEGPLYEHVKEVWKVLKIL